MSGQCTIAIEEPENGVHPARMRGLIETLRESACAPNEAALGAPGAAQGGGERGSDPVQVVLTSHSPAVLSALLAHPEDIACIDMVRRGLGPRITRARRLAKAGETARGETTVPRAEIERLLGTASLPDSEAGGP